MYSDQLIKKELIENLKRISVWPSWKIASVQKNISIPLNEYVLNYKKKKNNVDEDEMENEMGNEMDKS